VVNVVDYNKVLQVSEFENNLQKYKPFKYFTQTVLFKTHLYGKYYFWMEDVDGHLYLVHEDEDGLPDLG
jgi:hypothetical protein